MQASPAKFRGRGRVDEGRYPSTAVAQDRLDGGHASRGAMTRRDTDLDRLHDRQPAAQLIHHGGTECRNRGSAADEQRAGLTRNRIELDDAADVSAAVREIDV